MNVLEIRGEGRVLRGAPTPEAETGLFVGLDGLQGWQGLPARRRETLSRTLSAGEHDVPVRLPARVITIDPGHILARHETEMREHCDAMNGWGAGGRRFELAVTHLGQTLKAMVRVISSEGIDLQRRSGGILHGSMAATLVAADPRKYAAAVGYPIADAGGTSYVQSRGNFPAHPVVEFPNAPSSYSVTSPGGVFTVTGAASGGTHRVDLRTGRVTRSGVWLPGVGRGQLFAIPNGTHWPVTLSAPGRVVIRDTYV